MQNTTTTDLSEFGFREIKMLRDLLDSWVEQGLPNDFYAHGVHAMLNKISGYVFLINSDYQVAMINGDRLESFYSSPYEGREGFFGELKEEFSDMHPEDKEWFRDIAKAMGEELPEAGAE